MLRVEAFLNASDYHDHRPQSVPRTLPKEPGKAAQALSFEEVLRQVQRSQR